MHEGGAVQQPIKHLIRGEGAFAGQIFLQQAKVGFIGRGRCAVIPQVIPEDPLYPGSNCEAVEADEVIGLSFLVQAQSAVPARCPPDLREPDGSVQGAQCRDLTEEPAFGGGTVRVDGQDIEGSTGRDALQEGEVDAAGPRHDYPGSRFHALDRMVRGAQ
jgi:hypothetical protein